MKQIGVICLNLIKLVPPDNQLLKCYRPLTMELENIQIPLIKIHNNFGWKLMSSNKN